MALRALRTFRRFTLHSLRALHLYYVHIEGDWEASNFGDFAYGEGDKSKKL